MADEIINKVSNSSLVVLDLEDYYPEGERILFDIKDWLYKGLVLKEKDFRQKVSANNWEQYKDKFVALTSSTDAIVPAWAYMLISVHLEPFVKKSLIGNLETLESSIYQDIIQNLDASDYKDKLVIIKGCSNKPVPDNALILLSQKLQPVVKSIMYGEACSSVPLFKRK